MERLSWNVYNESESLIPVIEAYKSRNRFCPKRILVDKIYRNRQNVNYCKQCDISIIGPYLGKPKKNKSKEERKQKYLDACERNEVEGKFGTAKVRLD